MPTKKNKVINMESSRPCAALVEAYKKHGSSYVKKQIRRHEKILTPNVLERWQLCEDYRTLCHVEGQVSEIYKLCVGCKFRVDAEACAAMHDPSYEYEIIWGNVYKKTAD